MITIVDFPRILFEACSGDCSTEVSPEQDPDFFTDLNLDQVVQSITANRPEYNLAPFFRMLLPKVSAVIYRQEVLQDLEDLDLVRSIEAFAAGMRRTRERLAQAAELHYKQQKERWHLDAVDCYVNCVRTFASDLDRARLQSHGFRAFRDYLAALTASEKFTNLVLETRQLKDRLGNVTYCMHIRDDRITVSAYSQESDFSSEVSATFERFQQRPARDYRVNFPGWSDMNHVETGVLDMVSRLYPGTFSALSEYDIRYRDFLDPGIVVFDREVQFYLAYREFTGALEGSGCRFCYPRVDLQPKEISAQQTFDIALATKLVGSPSPIVCNDFRLSWQERIFVVSGPNQGGKTTFARTFGQVHYLANLGLTVPGTHAQLPLFDKIFTHFEREENLQDLSGKLQDDLQRIHRILESATSRSIIIMNEIFTSTTLDDAVFLGSRVLETVVSLGSLCVCVTFVEELATLSPSIVSMVSTVAAIDPSMRTYKIERRAADGLSYALAIAEKYGLTYPELCQRLAT